jgi:large subunit ribosomal protein L2
MFGVKFKFLRFTRAGQSRGLGIRPSVRGVAMNPVDHPHGGGEGRTSGGRPSSTPWGRLTKGYPTASRKYLEDKFITFLFRNRSLARKRRNRKQK